MLNLVLTGDHGLEVAILVNDFGKITVDAERVIGADYDVISLASRSVCCQVRDDLIDTIEDVLSRRESIDFASLDRSQSRASSI